MLMLFMSLFVLFCLLFFGLSWYFFSILLLFSYPFFFLMNFSQAFLSKNIYISIDFFSFSMIALSIWIVFLSIFSSFFIFEDKFSFFFLLCMVFLLLVLIVFFSCSNLFAFFFFFEASVFPTLYVIIGWGNKVERVQSGFYLFFYTLFGSMPMMFSIFFILSLNSSVSYFFFDYSKFFSILEFFFLFPFLIKMPMFLVHSWLPKAHVEAPVAGSMILAGVLLKMGGYGIFRFLFFFKYASFNWVWIYLSIWGGVLSGFICLRQVDLKSLIAFSSVSHMSLVIMGFLTFSSLGVFGSLMLMVAHGLCSSALFFLANVVYERSGTRSIFLNKGLMSIYPSLSLWWFIMCSFNMAAPPSLNLISEIFLLLCLVSWNFIFVPFLMLMCFIGGAYNLFLFSFCNHGKLNSNFSFFSPCYMREYYILYLHVFPITVYFLKLEFFF